MTEGVSASFGKPLQTNTSKGSMLCSQVRSQGNTVKNDPEHPEQGYSPASFGKPNAGRFGFSCHAGKGQMSSEHSGRDSDSPAVGNRVHVTQETEIRLELDHEQQVHAKSFPKCDKQNRK